jgi:hypothetical protein
LLLLLLLLLLLPARVLLPTQKSEPLDGRQQQHNYW